MPFISTANLKLLVVPALIPDVGSILITLIPDSDKFETRITNENGSFEELNLEKEKLYLQYKDDNITQIWFMNIHLRQISHLKNKIEIFNDVKKLKLVDENNKVIEALILNMIGEKTLEIKTEKKSF